MKHYVLVGILSTEKSCLGMAFTWIVFDATFWSRAFRLCKMHHVLEVTILKLRICGVITTHLLLNDSLFKLILLLLCRKHFLLFISQNWVFWCLLLLLHCCLCRTHHSSNKLISANHTHTVFCVTLCWRTLNRISNRSWIIISGFGATRYIIRLYDYTIFAWNPRIAYWWIVAWLEFAVADAFTVILIWILL